MVLWGCVGCCQIGFMILNDYENDLVIKHSYCAFIMYVCKMNIFVVCILQVFRCRLIQPVEMYTNWYMMWYLKKICSARNISSSADASFSNGLSILHFWSVWPFSIIQRICSTWNMSTGWRTTARPTKKKMTMDRPFQQWCISQKDMFLAEHIFLGTTSCTNLCRLPQVESGYSKTPVEHILQKYSSGTFTW